MEEFIPGEALYQMKVFQQILIGFLNGNGGFVYVGVEEGIVKGYLGPLDEMLVFMKKAISGIFPQHDLREIPK